MPILDCAIFCVGLLEGGIVLILCLARAFRACCSASLSLLRSLFGWLVLNRFSPCVSGCWSQTLQAVSLKTHHSLHRGVPRSNGVESYTLCSSSVYSLKITDSGKDNSRFHMGLRVRNVREHRRVDCRLQHQFSESLF